MQIKPRERLIVALDVPSVEAAQALVARLGDAVSFYKIGYQLAFAGGIAYAHSLIDAGNQVFVDLKLHDIGNTVAQGVKSVARLGATFLTVHAYPQTMQAAVQAREGNLRILAVTVLTSFDDADLKAAGYAATVAELVARRAAQAREIGVDGVVCSPEEAANLRAIVGDKLCLVTPGIRPAGADIGDQKRIATPAAAIAAGADYLSSAGRSLPRPIRKRRRRQSSKKSHRQTAEGRAHMAKGYWLAHVDVNNEAGYKAYAAANPAIFKKFGGRFVVRAGKFETPEGSSRSRNVVIEFPDYAAALACYRSPEYQANIKVRQPHSVADIIIIEGYDGPQP